MAERPRQPPEPLGDTVRNIERRAREIGAHGDRRSRLGLALIVAGGALLVIAIIGAILVTL